MFSSVLIANRGEIACRIIRTVRRMGLRAIAVYSDADRHAPHVAMADAAVHVGSAPAADSYLRTEHILAAAEATAAEAIHPGYGFLAENADFAEAVERAGLVFVGPPAGAIRAMGLKDGAKRLMEQAGVPVVPGYHGDDQSTERLADEAERIGFPVLIKAIAGGGGKGMRRVDKPGEFAAALTGARREARSAFGDDRVLVEKFILKPRHIEIQVFADTHGTVVHLFERDCSLQRRHQKVIEEAPAPGMPAKMRAAMGEAACEAARAIGYRGAGTVEFIAGAEKGLRADRFFFMEMNTRLQVEHPVTEMITGQDLVEWQLRVAAGEKLPLTQSGLEIRGHAVEARLYAENPHRNFLPATGTLHHLRLETGDPLVRVDAGVEEGDTISIHYDPMIAKLIAWDETRTGALTRLAHALRGCEVAGVTTNLTFLAAVLCHPQFRAGKVDTDFIARHLADLAPDDPGVPVRIKFLAALYLLAERPVHVAEVARFSGDPYSPWHAADSFRLNANASEVLRFAGPEPFEVHVHHHAEPGWRLETGGEAVEAEAELADDRRLDVVLDGVRMRAAALRLGRKLHIMCGGNSHVLTLHDPLDAELLDEGGAETVTAPMPGKIISVLTAKGARVRRGEALLVLEAMKMEHTLAAGRDGEVTAVAVAEGDQVSEGALLVSFAAEG